MKTADSNSSCNSSIYSTNRNTRSSERNLGDPDKGEVGQLFHTEDETKQKQQQQQQQTIRVKAMPDLAEEPSSPATSNEDQEEQQQQQQHQQEDDHSRMELERDEEEAQRELDINNKKVNQVPKPTFSPL